MTLLRTAGRLLLALVALCVIYSVVALVLTFWTVERPRACPPTRTLYLTTNGVHLDLVVPVDHASAALKTGLRLQGDDRFLAFGWGDREFYLHTPTWNDLTLQTAVQALFWKSATLMHVTRYRQPQTHWIAVPLCEEQLEELMAYIDQSFATDAAGKVLLPGEGYGPRDDFYKARGSYSCLNTCNTWGNTGLQKIGLKTPLWTPFDFGVLRNFE
ncbi:TIGR02117 family protein [Catalinimonas alkaloidigena]|nr:TIGR02117 family protein [Catalinimonas alkaloidigena]